MFIWLPPSEGKSAPTTGPSLDLDSLAFPELGPQRSAAIDELAALSCRPDAAQILGLGARSASDAQINTVIRNAPCARADQVFTGVLYEAAQLANLDPESSGWAQDRVLIFSGLFGVLAPKDSIPNHRLAMGVTLPNLGKMSMYWKGTLDSVLRSRIENEPVLDMRSGPYQSACPAHWATVIEVNVVQEVGSVRRTVSHNAKKWRGLLTGALLRLNRDLLSVDEVLDAVQHVGSHVAFTDASGREHRLANLELGESVSSRRGGTRQSLTLVTA
ncbi:YaaA family protein [Schaalia vaccimaxillae]|uniref:YaaA family protein n=1 Tax=Schaalia vaccimaxillae TaxID=183916 RepID=UPI0003B3766B|nr:peroxide stress protein YaaA [Schaalia vaccimaxillae]